MVEEGVSIKMTRAKLRLIVDRNDRMICDTVPLYFSMFVSIDVCKLTCEAWVLFAYPLVQYLVVLRQLSLSTA